MTGLPRPGPSVMRTRMDSSLAVVNLVLLLLFFFMVAGLQPGLAPGVAPPATRDLALAGLPSPVLVVAGPEDWLLDGQPVAPALLPAALPPGDGRVLHLVLAGDAPAELLTGVIANPALASYRLRLVTVRDQAAP